MRFSGVFDAVLAAMLLAAVLNSHAQVPQIPKLNLGDLGSAPFRSYGTPTESPSGTPPLQQKRCFDTNIPVALPLLTLPTVSAFLDLSFLAKLSPAVPTTIYGELCMSQEAMNAAAAGKAPTVILLTHGITYGTWYWDFPYKPEQYSIVNHLIKAGYATLNIDRLGHGRSAHPPSLMTLMANQAYIGSQLVNKLRNGKIGGITFKHVISVGHSYGSGVAHLQTASFNDTDALIITGWSHRLALDSTLRLVSPVIATQPALIDPRTSKDPWALDVGYLMPIPGSRGNKSLHNPDNVEAGVVALDEKLANTVTAPEIGTFTIPQYTGAGKAIRVPTFTIIGQRDTLFCGNTQQPCRTSATVASSPAELEAGGEAFRQWDGPAFANTACFRAAVVPDAGHDLSLEKNAPQFAAQIVYFANQAVGINGENAAAYKARCAAQADSLIDGLPDTTRLIPPLTFSGN